MSGRLSDQRGVCSSDRASQVRAGHRSANDVITAGWLRLFGVGKCSACCDEQFAREARASVGEFAVQSSGWSKGSSPEPVGVERFFHLRVEQASSVARELLRSSPSAVGFILFPSGRRRRVDNVSVTSRGTSAPRGVDRLFGNDRLEGNKRGVVRGRDASGTRCRRSSDRRRQVTQAERFQWSPCSTALGALSSFGTQGSWAHGAQQGLSGDLSSPGIESGSRIADGQRRRLRCHPGGRLRVTPGRWFPGSIGSARFDAAATGLDVDNAVVAQFFGVGTGCSSHQ